MAQTGNQKENPGESVLSRKEIAAFCAQISMVLKSGIPIVEGIEIMAEDAKNNHGQTLLEKLHTSLENGNSFDKAVATCGFFPKYLVDMTAIGVQTGRLDDVMDSLCAYYEREEAISKSIRNAVTYPLVMISMMVLVIIVLVVQVLPVFNQVFEQLGAQMSGFSRSMMDFGAMLRRYSFVIVGIFALLVMFFGVLRATKWGTALLDRWKTVMPISRRLYTNIASGRFASAMSMMLSSGLDVDESLGMVNRLIENPFIHDKVSQCQHKIAEGFSFSDAVVQSGIFTGVYGRMVSVGFKTGSADVVMTKLADQYEDEVNTQIGNTISVLEPTLVAILSIIVGMILLSVMVPLLGIMSSIG